MNSMDRAKDYEKHANPIEVLKGTACGGSLIFQIKRYKQGLENGSLEAGVEVILSRTLAILEAAVECSPKVLATLPEPRRVEQLKFLQANSQ